jgi:hypothetical protein
VLDHSENFTLEKRLENSYPNQFRKSRPSNQLNCACKAYCFRVINPLFFGRLEIGLGFKFGGVFCSISGSPVAAKVLIKRVCFAFRFEPVLNIIIVQIQSETEVFLLDQINYLKSSETGNQIKPGPELIV